MGQILPCRWATPCIAGVLQHSGFNSSDAHSTLSTRLVTKKSLQPLPVISCGGKSQPWMGSTAPEDLNRSPSNGAKEALDKCWISASLPSLPFSEGVFYKFSMNLKTRMFEFGESAGPPQLTAFSSSPEGFGYFQVQFWL